MSTAGREPTGEGALARLIEWAGTHLPALVDEACALVLDRIPLYRSGEVVPVAELRSSIASNMAFLVEAMSDPDVPLDLRAPRETGQRRAEQAAPLPEVLQAYRISFATLWNALVVRARRSELPTSESELLTAASRMWQLTDQHALAVTEAYRAATAEIMLRQQQRRGALVEALLTGQMGADAGPWDAAILLGLPPDGDLVVVAAETGRLAEASLPGAEQELAARGIASGWRLMPAMQVGIVAVPADRIEDVLAVLRGLARARTGVSPLYRSIGESPRSFQLARAALATVPAGRAEVARFAPSPLAALMACQPGEGERLAQEVLGGVLALPDDDRETMLTTLEVFLEQGGSTEQAAGPLHCHPNTVRYRLRRLGELTGRSTSDPYGLAELAAASYALRLSGGRRP